MIKCLRGRYPGYISRLSDTAPFQGRVRCFEETKIDPFELMLTGELGAVYEVQCITNVVGVTDLLSSSNWLTMGLVTNRLGRETVMDLGMLASPP